MQRHKTLSLRAGTARRCLLTAFAAAIALGGFASPGFADPPAWAPAHGYRAKHGDSHRDRRRDAVARIPFGIDAGRCNRQEIGALLGGAAGAAAGSTIGSGDGRLAAIIGGTVLGALVGGSIGRHMDEVDQSCVAQVMEYADTGETIVWDDPSRRETYRVTPIRSFQPAPDRYCREYTAIAVIDGRRQRTHGTACREEDGRWRLVS